MHQPSRQPESASASQEVYAMLDDPALMRLIEAGNHEAFTIVVCKYTPRLLTLAKRTLGNTADAEDVVQSIFIKLWQNPNAWDSAKSALSTWLYRVVLNACYDVSRKRQSVGVTIDYESADSALTQSPDVLETVGAADQEYRRRQLMLDALSSLPESQRDAINLAVFAEMPQKQVAAVLGVSVKAVESLLVRAKAKLKQMISHAKTMSGER